MVNDAFGPDRLMWAAMAGNLQEFDNRLKALDEISASRQRRTVKKSAA